MPTTDQLLVNLILFGLLPLWGITGFIDWCCHRATRVEHTSGLRESLVHSLMGIQLGIPIILCLLYYVNVMILLICLVAFVCHEIVAHYDVHYSAPLRRISIWEVHVHNYMATIPLYLLMLIAVLNWDVVQKLVSLDWAGQFTFERVPVPHGGTGYMRGYLAFMGVLCVVPYLEENLRCWRARTRAPQAGSRGQTA
jgi:hypothetical protein